MNLKKATTQNTESNSVSNKETVEAIKEVEKLKTNKSIATIYDDVNVMIVDLLSKEVKKNSLFFL